MPVYKLCIARDFLVPCASIVLLFRLSSCEAPRCSKLGAPCRQPTIDLQTSPAWTILQRFFIWIFERNKGPFPEKSRAGIISAPIEITAKLNIKRVLIQNVFANNWNSDKRNSSRFLLNCLNALTYFILLNFHVITKQVHPFCKIQGFRTSQAQIFS